MAVIMSYHGTVESRAALVEAVNLAKRLDEKLLCVYAQKHRGDDQAVDNQVMEVLHDALGQENLEYAVQLCPRGKDVSEYVLEAARENHASYLVIGLAHRSRYGSMNIGPNAQRLLLEAPCPVVTYTTKLN